MKLLSTLILNESPLSSSIDNIQYSSDGQIAVVTRSAIHILTPNFDPEVKEKSPKNASSSGNAFEWSETAIHDLGKRHVWSDDSDQWRTVSLGSLEVAWLAATWSPSGTSKLGGCILATLTNNMEVSIWTPIKNPLTGEWIKLQDITEEQTNSFGESSATTADILQCQASSISWSSSLWEEACSATVPNSSLLALGNRYGNVDLFYWDTSSNTVRCCLTHNIGNVWVTRLLWSRWKPTNATQPNGIVQARLACGLSDGSITVLTVQYDTNADKQYSIPASSIVAVADSRSVTAMIFAEVDAGHKFLLAFAKPGFVCLYKDLYMSESRMEEDPSFQTVVLSAPPASIASSSVSTCTGMYYISSEDCLVIALAEGTINVVADASGRAHLKAEEDSSDQPINFPLSNNMRQLAKIAEERLLEESEYVRIHALYPAGDDGYAIWIQEVLQPYDLSFRIQAHVKIRVCVAKLWNQESDANRSIISVVRAVLSDTRSIVCFSPTVLFREAMLGIVGISSIVSFAPRLLPLLSPEWVPEVSNDANSEANLTLFVYRTRVKLNLALFILNRPGLSKDLLLLFSTLYDKLLDLSAALHVYQIAEKIFEADDLSALDQLSVGRFIHAAQYCSVPDTLVNRFSRMKQKCQEHARQHEAGQQLPSESNDLRFTLELSRGVDLGEKCPACDEMVPFRNLAQGQCQRGHVWERCAASLRMIAGIGSLTCIGCGRKALDANPQTLTYPGTHCILCGSRYFRAL